MAATRGRDLDDLTASYVAEVDRFCRLLPGAGEDDASRGELGVLGSQLSATVGLLVNAQRGVAAEAPGAAGVTTVGRVLALLRREITRFEAGLLADTGDAFDDEAYARRLERLTDEELDREAGLLDDCDDSSTIDALERELDGLAGLKPVGRVAKIKALILLIAELIIRLKNLPGAEAIRRILRKLARIIDKTIGGTDATKPKVGAAPESGKPPTAPGSGSSTSSTRPGVCLVEVFLDSMTATSLAAVGGNQGWQLDFSMNGAAIPHLRGEFSGSPLAWDMAGRERLLLTTFEPCGPQQLSLEFKISRTRDPRAAGEATEWVRVNCDGQTESRRMTCHVYRDGNMFGGSAELTLQVRVFSTCTPAPQAPGK